MPVAPPAPTGYYAVPYAPAPGVPPLPPRGRSTGFWVGITAAVTFGVVGALLVGFFIGRGTRLSNDSVQGRIIQQSQSDQIAEQTALDAQKTKFQGDEAAAIGSARTNAYRQGQTAGYNNGYRDGQAQGQQQANAVAAASQNALSAANTNYQNALATYDACLYNPSTTFCGPAPTPPGG